MEIKGRVKKKTIEVVTTDDTVCNKCGESMQIDMGTSSPFYSGTRLLASFGYGSDKDGLEEHFDICDSCYDNFIKSFKHEPEANRVW